MEDLSDITDALVAAIPSSEPDGPREGVQIVNSASIIPLEAPLSNAEDDASEEWHNIHNATQAPQQSTLPTPPVNPADADAEARLRLELFANMFFDSTVSLKTFAPPAQCAHFPEHQDQILESFLDNAIFTVQIWTNFDAAEETFFEGARAAECGKLQLPKKKLDWLLERDQRILSFHHVRLDIGTPFRTLVHIFLDVRYDQNDQAYLEVRATMAKRRPPRRMGTLREFIQTCIRRISEVGSDRSLDIRDLVDIATLFRRFRGFDDDDGDWEAPAYEGGEWVGIEEPPLLLQNSRWAM